MSKIIDDARAVLESVGFATFLARPDASSLDFEDISIMGRLHVLESADQILKTWQSIQDQFLSENAEALGRDTTKAWNLYTILLTSEPPRADIEGRLFSIEDDFRGTRKIARGGIVSREDVTSALSPILPLQNVLPVDLADSKQRMLERLASVRPALRNLATGTSAESIVAALLESE
jgi:hypothetical protein